nr:hypothetical protein [Tanacetum cinerariifolium]
FFVEKQQEEEPGKTNAKAEVQSMVSVPIHQDTSSVPLMTTSVIDITMSQSGSPLPKSSATISTNLNIPHQVSKAIDEIVTNAVDWAMQAPLRARFSDLPAVDMKEILQQRMFKDKSYEAHEDRKKLYDALEKSLERDYSDQLLSDLEKARQKKKRDVTYQEVLSGLHRHSHLLPLLQRLHLVLQVHLSDDEDSGNDHLPKADLRKGWWKPLSAEERPATPEPTWTIPSSNVSDVENNWATALTLTYVTPAENSLLAKTRDMMNFLNWYCRQVNKTKLTQADLEGQAYEVVKAFYLDVNNLQSQMEECHKLLTYPVDWTNPEGDQVRIGVNRPLPLGGPLCHVTIQSQFFFNKNLEYLRHGSKGSSPALLISKMKAASYLDFSLELLMLEQIWIEDVCNYDISAKYGISHWWFNRQKFYIDRHDSLSRQKEVRSHMRILSVVRIKAYSRYRYDYLSKTVLRRVDLQEHTIAEKDFKNLHLSDFEDLNLLLLQGYEFKHDYTIIESPRAIVFPVNKHKQKIIRFNKIYKFSDGTLTWILEALAYKVKKFKIKRLNPVTMEILLEPTSNKLLVGDVGDSIWIELVTLDINPGPE